MQQCLVFIEQTQNNKPIFFFIYGKTFWFVSRAIFAIKFIHGRETTPKYKTKEIKRKQKQNVRISASALYNPNNTFLLLLWKKDRDGEGANFATTS